MYCLPQLLLPNLMSDNQTSIIDRNRCLYLYMGEHDEKGLDYFTYRICDVYNISSPISGQEQKSAKSLCTLGDFTKQVEYLHQVIVQYPEIKKRMLECIDDGCLVTSVFKHAHQFFSANETISRANSLLADMLVSDSRNNDRYDESFRRAIAITVPRSTFGTIPDPDMDTVTANLEAGSYCFGKVMDQLSEVTQLEKFRWLPTLDLYLHKVKDEY